MGVWQCHKASLGQIRRGTWPIFPSMVAGPRRAVWKPVTQSPAFGLNCARADRPGPYRPAAALSLKHPQPHGPAAHDRDRSIAAQTA